LKIGSAFSIQNIRALCVDNYYSNQKAKIHLNIFFTPINSGVGAAVLWFNNNY
jgi:hypothetical protein